MKIARNYIIINSFIIASTTSFATFLILYQLTEPNFTKWITGIGLFLWCISLFSFLWNFKSLNIEQDKIYLKRLLLPDIKLTFQEIQDIEENNFRYISGSSNSNIYKGFYLTIRTANKKIKTSSLNEPNYDQLRNTLKSKLGKKVKLMDNYSDDRLNWFLLTFMLIPTFYLVKQIIIRLNII